MQIPLFMASKRCKDCEQVKPLSDFPANGGGTVRPECTVCHNARNREHYELNPDRFHAAHRRYREKQGEAWNDRSRIWREANPDYYSRNAERLRAQGRIKAAARRAKQRGLPTERIDPLVVLEMDDGICGICGEDVNPEEFEVDHIVPVALGGSHLYSNVQVAHKRCNQRKGDREDWQAPASI